MAHNPMHTGSARGIAAAPRGPFQSVPVAGTGDPTPLFPLERILALPPAVRRASGVVGCVSYPRGAVNGSFLPPS
jgi:hypothetical protein